MMNKIEGFLGIPFGSDMNLAKQKINERIGVIDESISNETNLIIDGISFAGRNTEFIMLTFFDNQLCKGSVFIKPHPEGKIISTYNEIKKELNNKYYVSDKDFEIYDYPYEKEDGSTLEGIIRGIVEFSCYWNFASDNDFDDYISIAIDSNLNIVIIYENGILLDKLVKNEQEKNNLDY